MADDNDSPGVIRLAGLRGRTPVPVRLEPAPEARAAIAGRLGLDALRKLRFEGTLTPEGRADWRLDARLGATVVQPCVATLAPVTTRIDTDLVRLYRAEMTQPEGDETEMPEDDTEEPLPDRLDLAQVMEEALALALPLYPRADDAGAGPGLFGPPGVDPLRDEDLKPFAGLAALKKKLEP